MTTSSQLYLPDESPQDEANSPPRARISGFSTNTSDPALERGCFFLCCLGSGKKLCALRAFVVTIKPHPATRRVKMAQPHHHHQDHHHHHHSSNPLVKIAQALHLPGFTHDHSHQDLAADRAFLDNRLAVRTVWIALVALGLTTALQVVIYVASGSVALLADTVHNLGDALNSIPLLFAFYIARRAANKRFTYGYGRLEDIAGVFIVISIGFSAAYIIYESVQRLFNPLPLANLEWIALAALVGFVGNELVALMQIRVGRRIGSDAMIADGQHALIDGLTSLAVLIAVIGSLIGAPILDPIVGVIIGFAIVGITWNAIKAVWYRMMDAVDPHLVEHVEAHVLAVAGVEALERLRLRWVGHRMYGVVKVTLAAGTTMADSQQTIEAIQHEARQVIPQLEELTVQVALAER